MENNDTSYIFENFTAQLWTTTDGPKSLYHYTTTEGARSIISNGKFWVSSFETMNDNQELKKGLHIAKGDLPIFLKDIAHLEFAQVII